MFTLTIETDNDAFSRLPGGELCRILRALSHRVEGISAEDGDLEATVRDVNGNTVGRWTYNNYPEGTEAGCLHCGRRILLDQREGGGSGKDWGDGPDSWQGNGGIGMDYGCPDSPDTDGEGTGGHAPDLATIELP